MKKPESWMEVGRLSLVAHMILPSGCAWIVTSKVAKCFHLNIGGTRGYAGGVRVQ